MWPATRLIGSCSLYSSPCAPSCCSSRSVAFIYFPLHHQATSFCPPFGFSATFSPHPKHQDLIFVEEEAPAGHAFLHLLDEKDDTEEVQTGLC